MRGSLILDIYHSPGSVANHPTSILSRRGGLVRTLIGREVPANAPGDPGHSCLDRVARQVRVTGGRLDLRATEQLPDHGQALTQVQRP